MTTTPTTYSPESQRNFSIQWFKSWSDFQKDDFVKVLGQKLGGLVSPPVVNGLVNGMQDLSVSSSGRPPSLFACQVKLFSEWWDTWPEADKTKMTELLKEADPKFWETVEAEISGTRVELNEDFMIVTVTEDANGESGESTNNDVGSGDAPLPAPVFKVKQIVTGSSFVSNNRPGTNDDEDNGNTEEEPGEDVSPENEPSKNGESVHDDRRQESPESPVATEI